MSNPHAEYVSLDRFDVLLEVAVGKIRAAAFRPDSILALSTGGFPVAAALAKRLNLASRNVIGLPVYRDADGEYHLDERLVTLAPVLTNTTLVVDEASNRGLLTEKVVSLVRARGGQARSCVLIARQDGRQPDFVAETCSAKPPKFYWEAIPMPPGRDTRA